MIQSIKFEELERERVLIGLPNFEQWVDEFKVGRKCKYPASIDTDAGLALMLKKVIIREFHKEREDNLSTDTILENQYRNTFIKNKFK